MYLVQIDIDLHKIILFFKIKFVHIYIYSSSYFEEYECLQEKRFLWYELNLYHHTLLISLFTYYALVKNNWYLKENRKHIRLIIFIII